MGTLNLKPPWVVFIRYQTEENGLKRRSYLDFTCSVAKCFKMFSVMKTEDKVTAGGEGTYLSILPNMHLVDLKVPLRERREGSFRQPESITVSHTFCKHPLIILHNEHTNHSIIHSHTHTHSINKSHRRHDINKTT